MKEIINRLKSPVTIMALAALIYFIVKTWFGFEIPEWSKFIELFVAAGIAVGIFNNPADKTGW